MGRAFIISFYREGARVPGDGFGPFPTRADAVAYAREEVGRVAAMPPDRRDHTLDWAHRFTIRKVPWPDHVSTRPPL